MNNQGVVGVAINSDALLLAIIILAGFLVLAILISLMRIYKKAGKPQISAIIPIWSQIALFQIVGKPARYIFLLLIPIVNIVVMFQAYILLAKKFGKGAGFGIAMIFLPMIFIPLLSFYDYIDDGEEKVEETVYNPFNESNVEQVMPSAPIDNAVNDVESPVMPINSEVDSSDASFQESAAVIENNNEIVEEVVEDKVENVSDGVSNEELSNGFAIPVIEPVMEVESREVVEEAEEQIQPNLEVQNPTVQDIENILNVKSTNEPKDIAFGATPEIVETPQEIDSVTENLDADNESDSLDINNSVLNNDIEVVEEVNKTEELIEMPEIAAKSCPACGVSLADDVKFCISCGTQL